MAPSVKEVLGKLPMEQQRAEKILLLLIQGKELVRVSEDLVFHAEAIRKLRRLVSEIIRLQFERIVARVAVMLSCLNAVRSNAGQKPVPITSESDRHRRNGLKPTAAGRRKVGGLSSTAAGLGVPQRVPRSIAATPRR